MFPHELQRVCCAEVVLLELCVPPADHAQGSRVARNLLSPFDTQQIDNTQKEAPTRDSSKHVGILVHVVFQGVF